MTATPRVLWFEELRAGDVARVGGKNASLGEMTRELAAAGVVVPGGFATTASAFRAFLAENALGERIVAELAAMHVGARTLREAGAAIRGAILGGTLSQGLRDDLLAAYRELGRRAGADDLPVAVRSSATAEDLPDASFAGQQETFLNVVGEAALLDSCRRCFASLYTDRAIAYRESKGFAHAGVALSVGVQQMVRSDRGAAGVMFTLEPDTGFPQVVLINASFGLGELVVKGTVDPDEIVVFKPALARPTCRPILRRNLGGKARTMVLGGGAEPTRIVDTPPADRARFAITADEALALARWAVRIEDHYSRLAGHAVPMDIEWAKDGLTGALYIVQARPETVQSRVGTTGRISYAL
ncbi:MAG: phosphoenolpyruvate synthase, partial [Gemmatimonadota bacterium]|nr:phosphoenolpyruvate synthase [Gemmatimonadota bacterium]